MKKFITMMFVALLVAAMSTPAMAAMELSETKDINHHKMWHKFKRGVVNVLTSPIEIPKQIKTEVRETDDNKIIAGMGGTVKGIAYGVGRLGSGLWDMVSFNLAIPDNYEPIMKPEYVCEKK